MSINPLDAKIRSGEVRTVYPAWFPDILGYDVAGVIEAVGATVDDFGVGDEVFGTLDPLQRGAYAEYVGVPAHLVTRKPSNLSFAQASTVGSALITAQGALFTQADLQAGQTVLIHGGSGAVGGLAIQLARRAGARVIASASTANLEEVRALGADVAVDFTRERFEDYATQVDVVLDTVGGETRERSYRSYNVLRPGGVLVSLVPPPPDAQAAEARKVRAVMSYGHPDPGRVLREMAPLLQAGELQPPRVARVLDLADAAEAHRLLESGAARRGRLVVEDSAAI